MVFEFCGSPHFFLGYEHLVHFLARTNPHHIHGVMRIPRQSGGEHASQLDQPGRRHFTDSQLSAIASYGRLKYELHRLLQR